MAKIHDELKEIFKEGNDPFTDIIGQESAKNQLKSALLAGRHVVIFGHPGIGKTTLAKNLARILPEIRVNDCEYRCDPQNPVCPSCMAGKVKKQITLKGEERFVRIQGSPDLTAEDLIGDIDPIKAMKFGPRSEEAFTPGKIFKANNSVLFFDELNRCPEKLQNALLEVLEERKATISGYDIDIRTSFAFIGTMNPIDINTERLSDVILDRFDVIYMGYPETEKVEKEIMVKKGRFIVDMSENLKDTIVSFVRELRENNDLEKVPSVRATLGLYERAQANAFLKGKNKAEFPDLKEIIVSVLAHRIRLKPSVKYLKDPKELIEQEFEKFVHENARQSVGEESGDSR